MSDLCSAPMVDGYDFWLIEKDMSDGYLTKHVDAHRASQAEIDAAASEQLRQDADNWRRWIARLNRLEPGEIISIGREPGQDVYDEDEDEYHLEPADDDHYWAQLTVEDEDSDVDCEVFEEGKTPLEAIIAAKWMEEEQ